MEYNKLIVAVGVALVISVICVFCLWNEDSNSVDDVYLIPKHLSKTAKTTEV